jgi:lysophospholipase L1-like esterase
VLAFGDSLTAGYQSQHPSHPYAARLRTLLPAVPTGR